MYDLYSILTYAYIMLVMFCFEVTFHPFNTQLQRMHLYSNLQDIISHLYAVYTYSDGILRANIKLIHIPKKGSENSVNFIHKIFGIMFWLWLTKVIKLHKASIIHRCFRRHFILTRLFIFYERIFVVFHYCR